jgi:hypothetical protein
MRMPDDLGQIKPGFPSDIILIDGDPLTDYHPAGQSRIIGIMKDVAYQKNPDTGTEARARELDEIHRGIPIPA